MQELDGALVLFSGGKDGATCLAWALERFERVETVGFDHGQRPREELNCRARFRDALTGHFTSWASKLGEDHTFRLDALAQLSNTALTREMEILVLEDGQPNTCVPGRNLLFCTYAAALTYRRDLKHAVGGMCETDYSGYPDVATTRLTRRSWR